MTSVSLANIPPARSEGPKNTCFLDLFVRSLVFFKDRQFRSDDRRDFTRCIDRSSQMLATYTAVWFPRTRFRPPGENSFSVRVLLPSVRASPKVPRFYSIATPYHMQQEDPSSDLSVKDNLNRKICNFENVDPSPRSCIESRTPSDCALLTISQSHVTAHVFSRRLPIPAEIEK